MIDLAKMIENEWWIVCEPLPLDRFISFCRERGIETSREQLERFEELGWFYPSARVDFPKMVIKVQYSEDRTTFADLGILRDGEVWEGETREDYSAFGFTKDWAEDWLESGNLWEPRARAFEPRAGFLSEDRRVESYYSRFQVLPLYQLQHSLQVKVSAEVWAHYGPDELLHRAERVGEWAKVVVQGLAGRLDIWEKASIISQAISNRYYPETQSDRRTLTVSHSGLYHAWSWQKYRSNWDAAAVLRLLAVSAEEVKKLQELTASQTRWIDPLADWYSLVRFVSVDQRARLKGKALLAQGIYDMEEMLRLFYKDLTGDVLCRPGESPRFKRSDFYGEGVPENELQFLEFLTNQYHLNPRPRLILLVEGEGERQEIPRIARELMGIRLERVGIRVEDLRGIGGASKLERFIDHYHYLQTIVYVILDNDQGGRKLQRELLKARSKYPGVKGGVTKPELLFLWQKSFEFDNFTDIELAEGMTEVAGHRLEFSEEEVRAARERFGRGKDPLSDLYEKRLSYALNKPELARTLVTQILAGPESELDQTGKPHRRVVTKIGELIQLAARNYQPVRLTDWERTQQSEFLRHQAGRGSDR